MIIGITSNTKVGKEKLSRFFQESYSFKYIDVDEILENVLRTKYYEVTKDQSWKQNLSLLIKVKNDIDQELNKQISQIDESKTVVLDYSLLEDSYFFGSCDVVIKVSQNNTHQPINDDVEALKYHRLRSLSSDFNPSKYHLELSLESDWEAELQEFIEYNIFHNSKITIVVPVYNTANYLSRCVNSITNQTYRNLEIILINDGSTDDSLRLCNLLAQTDDRIRVVDQPNSGLSETRNKGIELATGEYICFFDSDDYIEKNMIENLLKTAEKTGADVVEGSFFIHMTNGIVRDISQESTGVKIVEGTKNLIDAYADGIILIPAWDKLYKTKSIKGIKFDKTCFKEDSDYTFKLCREGKKFALDSTPYYHYVKRGKGSLTGEKFSERFFQLIDWGKNASQEVASMGAEYKDASEKILYNSLVHVLRNYMRDHKKGLLEHEEYKDEIQKIANELTTLLLNAENVAKFRKLNEVLDIINELISDGIIEKEKMPSIELPCVGILWNSLDEVLKEEALAFISEKAEIKECIYVDLGEKYREFIDAIYLYNNEFEGIPFIKSGTLIDKFDCNTIVILNMVIKVSSYLYFNKMKGYMFEEIAHLKTFIRKYFKTKIREYAYDNIFHLTVDQAEYEYTDAVCLKFIPNYGDDRHGKK